MMMKTEKPQLSFFLLWFPIVSLSIYLGAVLSYPLGEYLYAHNGISYYSSSNDGFLEHTLSLLLLVGLFMGLGQWIVINTKIKKSYPWIVGTLIGFVIGSFVFFFLFVFMEPITGKSYRFYGLLEMSGTLAGAGLFTGICQWLSLKRKVVTSLGWAFLMALSFAIGMLLDSLVDYPSRAINFIIFSITVGFITGIFAERLIVRPETQLQQIATCRLTAVSRGEQEKGKEEVWNKKRFGK